MKSSLSSLLFSMLLNMLLTMLLISNLTACSGGGGDGGGNGTGNGPQSKEEALQKLSPTHKANFDTWLSKVVKTCEASQAFGLKQDRQMQQEGVDGAALLKKNNGSVVFSDGKSLAILTGYNSISGVGSTKFEETSDLNGQTYSITAETKREGSNCTVYLYGQKVYETTFVESFTIGTQYSPNQQATSTSQIPTIRNLGPNGSAEVLQHGIFSLLSQSLKPAKEAQTFVGQSFGLNADQSARLFKLSNYTSANSAIRIDGDQTAVWTNAEAGNLIASGSNLKKYFDGTSRVLPFEVRLQIPQFDFKGTKNSADNGNLKIILSAIVLKKDAGFLYSLKSFDNQGLVPFDQAEAVNCSQDRMTAYTGSTVEKGSILPTVQILFGPCRTIFAEIEEISYKNGFLKSLISIVFQNVSPSTQFQYGGWDYVLSRLAKEAINQNKDISTELDPSNKTTIVSIVARHLNSLKHELEKSKNMQLSKNTSYEMGLSWSFQGQTVSAERVGQIIQSVDNSTDIFKASSDRLLNDMARNPNSNDDQLSFAQNIDGTYKSEATKALNLSKELSYGAFESEIFNQVIQRKTSVDDLKDWSNRFTSIKTEINKYASIGPVKGDLVGLSIKWLKNEEATSQDLASIYLAINNSTDPFLESSKQLIMDLGQSLSANKEALEFARSLTQEYKQLALSIRNNSRTAEYESWGQSFFNSVLQKRPAIEQLRQWSDLWTSALAFVQREKAKIAGELSSMPKWNRKKIIELAVKETWSGEDFTAFETIAQVGKAKSTCDRHKDASSQADCAGLTLFSKGQKKFFDPAYAGRYTTLAADYNNYMNRLSGFDWISLRRTLLDEFFGSFEPIWSKCDAGSFAQKSGVLRGQINAIIIEPDQFKKWDLERQIKETIKDCQ